MPLLHETSSTENDIEVGSRVLPTKWLVASLTDQWAERSLPSDMMDMVKMLVMTSPRPAMRHSAHLPLHGDPVPKPSGSLRDTCSWSFGIRRPCPASGSHRVAPGPAAPRREPQYSHGYE